MWTGDNLPVLRGLNADCIDLIYLDPAVQLEPGTTRLPSAPGRPAQRSRTRGRSPTWIRHGTGRSRNGSRAVYAAIDAAGDCPTGPSMKSYLIMMAVRLLELRRVPEADRFPLPALRYDCQSLPEAAARFGI